MEPSPRAISAARARTAALAWGARRWTGFRAAMRVTRVGCSMARPRAISAPIEWPPRLTGVCSAVIARAAQATKSGRRAVSGSGLECPWPGMSSARTRWVVDSAAICGPQASAQRPTPWIRTRGAPWPCSMNPRVLPSDSGRVLRVMAQILQVLIAVADAVVRAAADGGAEGHDDFIRCRGRRGSRNGRSGSASGGLRRSCPSAGS